MEILNSHSLSKLLRILDFQMVGNISIWDLQLLLQLCVAMLLIALCSHISTLQGLNFQIVDYPLLLLMPNSNLTHNNELSILINIKFASTTNTRCVFWISCFCFKGRISFRLFSKKLNFIFYSKFGRMINFKLKVLLFSETKECQSFYLLYSIPHILLKFKWNINKSFLPSALQRKE